MASTGPFMFPFWRKWKIWKILCHFGIHMLWFGVYRDDANGYYRCLHCGKRRSVLSVAEKFAQGYYKKSMFKRSHYEETD